MRPLTYILLFVFMACVLTMCGDSARAVSIKDGKTIELSDDEVATCAKEGGCILTTKNVLVDLLGNIKKLENQLKAEKSKQCV